MVLAEQHTAQSFALGLDAGGTYTDAVLVDRQDGHVVSRAKALTTPLDLSRGIASALDRLHIPDRQAVRSVSLATTLATNAIVEKRGGRVGLLLIGYDPKSLAQFKLLGNLPVVERCSLRGLLNEQGREEEPLDEGEVRATLQRVCGRVDALAISGYFGVRNPNHERRVRQLAGEVCAVPVVCGYEMTSRLDAVRRAVTTALNARLLPVLRHLMDALEACLKERDILAPLFMISGDGRLMTADEVRDRPVETILSGPAASVVAAQAMTGLRRAIVIDMGGTTSDIAVLREGQPGLSADGALVGGWPTSVNAVDVRTCGLGGDSHIQVFSGRLRIGPRRVCPISLAAVEYEQVMDHLRRLGVLSQVRRNEFPVSSADFLVQVSPAAGLQLDWQEQAVLGQLREGPAPVVEILARMDASHLDVQGIERLEERGLIQRIGLTPTDLLHARGKYTEWDEEAGRLATEIVSRQMGRDTDDFCQDVEERVVDQLAVEVLGRLLKDESWEGGVTGWDSYLLKRALDGRRQEAPIHCRITLEDSLVGLGAPALAFLPRLADKFNTHYICPPHADVGVALGAALAAC